MRHFTLRARLDINSSSENEATLKRVANKGKFPLSVALLFATSTALALTAATLVIIGGGDSGGGVREIHALNLLTIIVH